MFQPQWFIWDGTYHNKFDPSGGGLYPGSVISIFSDSKKDQIFVLLKKTTVNRDNETQLRNFYFEFLAVKLWKAISVLIKSKMSCSLARSSGDEKLRLVRSDKTENGFRGSEMSHCESWARSLRLLVEVRRARREVQMHSGSINFQEVGRDKRALFLGLRLRVA